MSPVEWAVLGLVAAPLVATLLLLLAFGTVDLLGSVQGGPAWRPRLMGLSGVLALALMTLTGSE